MAVYKELENLRQPEHSTAGSATFRNDITVNRAENSGSSPAENTGQPAAPKSVGLNQTWIPKAATRSLEQRILGQILDRFTPEGTPIPVN